MNFPGIEGGSYLWTAKLANGEVTQNQGVKKKIQEREKERGRVTGPHGYHPVHRQPPIPTEPVDQWDDFTWGSPASGDSHQRREKGKSIGPGATAYGREGGTVRIFQKVTHLATSKGSIQMSHCSPKPDYLKVKHSYFCHLKRLICAKNSLDRCALILSKYAHKYKENVTGSNVTQLNFKLTSFFQFSY